MYLCFMLKQTLYHQIFVKLNGSKSCQRSRGHADKRSNLCHRGNMMRAGAAWGGSGVQAGVRRHGNDPIVGGKSGAKLGISEMP